MKSAKEIFEELGYEYEKEEQIGNSIRYHKIYDHKNVYYPKKSYVEIWFRLDTKKVNINTDAYELTVKELNAVYLQLKELGWFDEN